MKWYPSVAVSMLLLAGAGLDARNAGAKEDVIADAYAAPAELVRLDDGRSLNLRCSGEGTPVVMLEAGGNADSSTWHRVQPRLAARTRVCAYDRAGFGFSEEGALPRNLDADVADLHALIAEARLPVPLLLVGHSLGTNIVRKYAQEHPAQVIGLVLLDPPEQGAENEMPPDWQSQNAASLEQRDAFITNCMQAAEANDAATMLQRCLRPPPAWMSEAAASAMQRNKSQPAYWRTLRSELESNIGVFAAPVPADESYGALPLALLQAPDQVVDAPDPVRDVIETARRQTHQRILAASTRSIAIPVPGASHDIQLDQPDAVVSAVLRLLDTKPDAANSDG
jgi:pimeloyl-ACP methyl ester carboxylesterase